jgi:hypothetical protein
MKEHPISFTSEMVRAILDGRKTQTRRVIKPTQKTEWLLCNDWADSFIKNPDNFLVMACPYGQSGDHLWVRETFAVQPELWAEGHGLQPIHYPATTPKEQIEDYVFKPSIYMPRWASRITLEIVNVRVERVQEITQEDSKAEGIQVPNGNYIFNGVYEYRPLFIELWNSINAKRGYGWDVNPWVWVIGFKKLEQHQ